MKSSKIEVDIVSDTDILIMLLLLMITKMMLTTNESNNYNNYNNNNVLIMKIIIVMHYNEKRLKVVMYIIRLISYSVKKMLLNSMFGIVKVICCF